WAIVMSRYLSVAAVTTACLVLFGIALTPVGAAPCTTDQLNGITNNANCDVRSGNDSAGSMNDGVGTFGSTNWTFLERWEWDDGWDFHADDNIGGSSIGLNLTGNAEAGTWSINNVWDLYESIALVLKAGP